MTRISSRVLDAITSLKLTIVCLVLLMGLVVACTLAQINLGTFGAVNAYVRSALVWWQVPGTSFSVPIFPGGGLVGFVLLVNLVAAQVKRLELSWRKTGLWIVHAGLILLFVGEFITGAFQKEMQLAIEEGQTLDAIESPREMELAISDVTAADHDEVYGIPESMLSKGKSIAVPGTPLIIQVRDCARETPNSRSSGRFLPGRTKAPTRGEPSPRRSRTRPPK